MGVAANAGPTTAMPRPAGVDVTYPAVAGSVPEARRSVARWLHSLSAEAVVSGDIELAVSEACTNAVLHGYLGRAAGAFRVRARDVGGAVHVTVTDDGGGMAPRPDSPGLGLGLPLMASVCAELRIGPAPRGTGTEVHMRFAAVRGAGGSGRARRP